MAVFQQSLLITSDVKGAGWLAFPLLVSYSYSPPVRPSWQAEHHGLIVRPETGGGTTEAPDVHLDGRQSARRSRLVRRRPQD